MKKHFCRILSVFLAALMLAGCSAAKPAPSPDPDPSPSADEPEKKPDEPKQTLQIETPAGAALVGVIKKDDDGWYFEPEQPISIRLTESEERILDFEAGTRIGVHNAEIDLVQYRDETVTIFGMLQDYRGAGLLYVYPCSIDHGKTVTQSQAVPELDYPEVGGNTGTYDPSIPLPTKMQPTVENGHYVYNRYILSKNTLEFMGNDFAEFYMNFVDAFFGYKTSCPCPEKFYADMLSNVLYYEFPLFTADGELDFLSCYDKATGTVHWSYTSKDKAEHEKLIREFEAEMNGFLSVADPTDSAQQKLQDIYHAFCPKMTYDYEALETFVNTQPYNAYSRHMGVCVTFAGALSQILNQAGVECTVVAGNTETIGHAWNMVTIDGKNYFCDATYELSYKNGTAYVYYGMTEAQRMEDGSILPGTVMLGGMNSKAMEPGDISETALRIL